jgi:hypothetical protein
MKHMKHLKHVFCNMGRPGPVQSAVRVGAGDERQHASTTSTSGGVSTTTTIATSTRLGSAKQAARVTSEASTTSVTKLTNYTKLSKKITTGADNLVNLSPYNLVVHKTMKDFKPTNIQSKIVQV